MASLLSPDRLGRAGWPALLVFLLAGSCSLFDRGPGIPEIEGRSAGRDSTALWVQIAVSSARPRGDTVSFRVAWGDGDTSPWTEPVPDDSSLTMFHTWGCPGRYLVRARLRTADGTVSGWSEEHPVVILANGAPWRPGEPAAPAYWQTDTTCCFEVSTRDREQDSVAFRLCWGDGDTSDWTGFVESEEVVTVGHEFTRPGVHEVSVQALDTRGAVSDWSRPASVTVLARGNRLKWQFDTGEPVYYGPAVGHDGTIYLSVGGRLAALDPDGTLLWTSADAGCTGTPTVGPDGTIYCGSTAFHAVNPDGSVAWSYPVGPDNSSAAIAPDGTVCFCGGSSLITLDPDGSLRWYYDVQALTWSSPAVGSDGTVYLGANDNNVYALNPDGTVRWSYPTGDWVTGSPALVGDTVIHVASNDGCLYTFNPAGELRWAYRFRAEGIVRSPAVGPDGTVYAGASDRGFYAIRRGGSTRWLYGINDLAGRCPAIAGDGTVYTGSSDGNLYAFFPDGTLKWKFTTGDAVSTHVTIGPDGTVYFGSSDGWLYALEGSAPPADAPWPMFQHNPRHTGSSAGF